MECGLTPQHAGYLLLKAFGQREMEIAAIAIVNRARERGDWTVDYTIDDLVKNDATKMDGLLMLFDRGYLKRYGQMFEVLEPFVERVCCAATHEEDWKNGDSLTHLLKRNQMLNLGDV